MAFLLSALLCSSLTLASTPFSDGMEMLQARDYSQLNVYPVDFEKRAASAPRAMELVQNYAGKSFFSNFDFFTAPDPTHGQVTYVDQPTATKNNLAYINSDGNAVLAVDSKSWVGNGAPRKSVRITSKTPFSQGQLLVLTAKHMPAGCSLWPAFWTVGQNWPNGGEIDIVEGVNMITQNQMTLHTTQGCSSTSSKYPFGGTGTTLTPDCNVYAYNGANLGCGVQDNSTQSYGPGFNANGGGAFATLWDNTGIKIWFFPSNKIPWDLRRARPVPSSWGKPQAFFSNQNCNTSKFFGNQTVVINTTINGDWAGAVFNQQGCPGSAAAFVSDPSHYKQAYWEIGSVRVYQ